MNFLHLFFTAMLAVAQPGVTDGSRIELTPRAAMMDREDGFKVAPPGFKWIRAEWNTWTRRESESEALERWVMIAYEGAKVVEDPPPEWRWRTKIGKIQLARALVTVMRHESAFWKSVHEGRLRGPNGEVCLIQAQRKMARALGYDPESLVGVTDEATERCLRVGAIILARARSYAERHCSKKFWFEAAVAVYGSGKGCVPEGDWVRGVEQRVATYAKTGARKPLGPEALAMLER